jgi:hypothetical protein
MMRVLQRTADPLVLNSGGSNAGNRMPMEESPKLVARRGASPTKFPPKPHPDYDGLLHRKQVILDGAYDPLAEDVLSSVEDLKKLRASTNVLSLVPTSSLGYLWL